MSQCYQCGSYLGCDVDCPNAPWNWDLPTTNRFGHLRRLVRWLREGQGSNEPVPGFTLTWGDWSDRYMMRRRMCECSSSMG